MSACKSITPGAVPFFPHTILMKELGQEQAPKAFQNIWEKHRHLFIAGIGPAGAPSRKRAAEALTYCKSILDVGCGPGVFLTTLQLIPRAVVLDRYVGVDAVADMLPEVPKAVTIQVEGEPDVPEVIIEGTVIFQHCTADKMPYADRDFEGVLVRHLLEHLENPLPVLKEACRLCSRTLVIVFSQWPRMSGRSLPTDAYLGAPRWAHPEQTLELAIRIAGFRRIDKELFNPNQRDRLAPREGVWTCQRNEETRSAI